MLMHHVIFYCPSFSFILNIQVYINSLNNLKTSNACLILVAHVYYHALPAAIHIMCIIH